jgi:hypothetical protein
MRLRYYILWIENDKGWYETTSELIKSEVEEFGFVPVEENIDSGKQLNELLEKDSNLSNYDIILVDYKLNNSENGDVLINRIRGNEIYTDVIFYSQDPQDLNDVFRKKGLEGVYISNREEIDEKFKKVMKSTIKKVEEVSSLRGLILSETSQLDETMLGIIKKFLNHSNEEKNENLKKYILEKISKTIEKHNEDFEQLKEENFYELLDKPFLFTSFHKSIAINKIAKISDKPEIKKYYPFHESYKTEIIKPRNIFAHVIEVEENGKIVLRSRTGEEQHFNSEKCIDMRKKIQKYSGILNDLNANI